MTPNRAFLMRRTPETRAPRTVFAVIYLDRGERHRLLEQPHARARADRLVSDLRAKGFRSWAEPITTNS